MYVTEMSDCIDEGSIYIFGSGVVVNLSSYEYTGKEMEGFVKGESFKYNKSFLWTLSTSVESLYITVPILCTLVGGVKSLLVPFQVQSPWVLNIDILSSTFLTL